MADLSLPDDDALTAIMVLIVVFALSWLADNMWLVWAGAGVAVLAGAAYYVIRRQL